MARVAIIGLGLIGTSLGLALKRAKVSGLEVVGHDKEPRHASTARKRGAVDRTHFNLPATVEGARLVIIATPVMAIREVLQTIAPLLEEGTVVTDTGSTKREVLGWAQEALPPAVSFVGGHPMAGKEEGGPEAAEADLFQGAYYALCPLPSAQEEAVRSVVGLVEMVGGRPYFVDPQEHDSYVSAVSHLPFLLSIGLVSATTKSPAWREMSRLASSGYRDLTRLASKDPQIHRDICLTNREGITYWVDEFIKQLYEFRRLLREDVDGLEKAFIQAWEARAKWLAGRAEEVPPSEVPRASDALASLFLGERLAKRMKELTQREKGDPTRYRRT